MRVLGVDPGLTRCGVGVVEGVPGRPCALVAYYVVYTDPNDDLALRLLHLDRSLTGLIAADTGNLPAATARRCRLVMRRATGTGRVRR